MTPLTESEIDELQKEKELAELEFSEIQYRKDREEFLKYLETLD